MKKHAHLLAILAVLLLCIGTVLWMKFGPTESGGGPEDTGADGGCKGIDAHKESLLKEKSSYETIEAYLRQELDTGVLSTGSTIALEAFAYPDKSSAKTMQQFQKSPYPQNVLDALYSLNIGTPMGDDDHPRPYYVQQISLYPEFTCIELTPFHQHQYVLFTAEGEPDKAAFLAAYPQYSDVTFTPVEGRWYITETIFAPLEEPEFRWEDYKGQLGIQWVIP